MENSNGNNQRPPSYSQPPRTASSNPQIRNYWIEQMENVSDFKNRQLPLARIKKIMKADPDVHMVSAEARSSSPRLAKCSLSISRCARGSMPRRTKATRFRNQISPMQWLALSPTTSFSMLSRPKDADPGFSAMPHPAGVPQYSYPPGMHAPPPAQAWPATAGEGEDEAGENGGNEGGN